MQTFNLGPIDTGKFGSYYVAAMSETYRISFGKDELFRSWAGPNGNTYLQKLNSRALQTDSFCRTLFDGEQIVGLIEASMLRPQVRGQHEGYLAFIFVDLQCRSKGAGDYLIKALTKWAADSDLRKLSLTVESANVDAIRFYKKHGWQDVGPSAKSLNAREFSLRL
ncbi:MAG: GNAT family N-acetyltransferase [Proteobacteria bacterium]|nr:MAG: GNAT family N-acetyltransferase [Pseudomonadota bacterium]